MQGSVLKTRKIQNSISMDEKIWDEIDQYKFNHKIENRSVATEILIKSGLDIETPREKANTLLDNIENNLTDIENNLTDDIVFSPDQHTQTVKLMIAYTRQTRTQLQKI